MMGAMGSFHVPPAPTAVTSFYDAIQRQHGGELFEQRCSTCHGDRGQGLTPEWRATWPEAEQNCWQSKCHASNHPPDGFQLPEYVPAVIGEQTLARFQTAQQLFEYLRAQMPYHAPGLLSDQDYWALTAFLLDAHRVPAGGRALDATTAPAVQLRPAPVPSSGVVPWRLAATSGAILLVLAGLVVWRRAGH
ncbi:MAG: c-type cytochrome [Ardenticatenaceae bacterium]|nr:c-type cytochrome [Ardenticatenaceae bacterium]